MIRDLWRDRDGDAVRYEFSILRKKVPYYGDPDAIAPQVGLPATPPRWEVWSKEQADAKAQADLDAVEVAKQERKERRGRYRYSQLYTSHASIWVFAVGFIATITPLIYTLGPNSIGNISLDVLTTNILATRQNPVGALIQSPLPLIFLSLVAVVSALGFGLGYRRALHPAVMAGAAVVGGALAAGVLFLIYRVGLASPALQVYSFPFIGTVRIPPRAPWGFAIACAVSYLVAGIVLGIVLRPIARRVFRYSSFGVSLSYGFAIGAPFFGVLLGISLGFLGWIGTGLVIGALVGILIGLFDVPKGDLGPVYEDAGLVTLTWGLILLIVLGLSSWFIVGLVFKLDSRLILYLLGGVAVSLVAGASLGATIKIWITRA